MNMALKVGAATDEVTVSAESPLLRTEDTQAGEMINNNFISNMPQLNRNLFALLSLAGDVSGGAANAANPATGRELPPLPSTAAVPVASITTLMVAW